MKSRSFLSRAAASVSDAASIAFSLTYLLGDHVWRRLTGRPSWTEELMDDLHFEIDERDVAKPYDSPGSGGNHVEEARTKQTARAIRITNGIPGDDDDPEGDK